MNTDTRITPYPLRLDPETRAKLETVAKANGRSLQAEISMRLEDTLNASPYTVRLTKEMKKKLEAIADVNGRAVSAEILFRLEASLEGILVRPPTELRQKLELAAYSGERSLQAEILMRLEESLALTKVIEESPPGSVIESMEHRMGRIAIEAYMELNEQGVPFSHRQEEEIRRLLYMELAAIGLITFNEQSSENDQVFTGFQAPPQSLHQWNDTTKDKGKG